MLKTLVTFLIGLFFTGVVGYGDASTPIPEGFYAALQARYGEAGRYRIEGWFDLLTRELSEPSTDFRFSLENANNYFNQVPWVSDELHWQKKDYWATPVEMLGTNGGDCEDFAIGKYFSLSEINIDKEKLRITYVKSLTHNQAHMVLVYYPTPTSDPLVLDNINKSILPASLRSDLVPIYSFNGDSIWLAKTQKKKFVGGHPLDQGGLPKWRDLNQRMQEILDRIRQGEAAR